MQAVQPKLNISRHLVDLEGCQFGFGMSGKNDRMSKAPHFVLASIISMFF